MVKSARRTKRIFISTNQTRRRRQAEQLEIARQKAQEPYHLLHIGKTGGTAIRAALQNRFTSPHDKHFKTNKGFTIIQHPHAHTLALIIQRRRDLIRTILFLRNPITRFSSGFNYFKRRGKPTNNIRLSPAEKQIFDTFQTHNDLAEALSATNKPIRTIARLACRETFRLPRYTTYLGRPHIFKERLPHLYFIGIQEHLETDFAHLCDKLDIGPTPIPHDPIICNKTPETPQPLSPKALKNLIKEYETDLVLYHMCCEERLRRITIP